MIITTFLRQRDLVGSGLAHDVNDVQRTAGLAGDDDSAMCCFCLDLNRKSI